MKRLVIGLLVTAGILAGGLPRQGSSAEDAWAAEGTWAEAMVATRHQVLAGAKHAGFAKPREKLQQADHRESDPARLMQHFWETYPETDWFLQDQPYR